MKPTVAILSIGIVPLDDILSALTESLDEENITRISLLGEMSREDVIDAYTPKPNEAHFLVTLEDDSQIRVGQESISLAMQNLVSRLDTQGYEVIMLLTATSLSGLQTENAILLESNRVVPPLIASVVQGHQVGMILFQSEQVEYQKVKWRVLETPPIFEISALSHTSETHLLTAGRKLLDQGATVILLDCLEFLQKHRDFLQKMLGIPVLLSNVFLIKIAVELLI